MVGVAYDCLANPLGAVRSSFEKAIASGSDPASFDGKDWGALDLFRHFLFDQAGLSQVPILNQKTVKWVQPNSLVRFRGMIQDMLGNEFYAGAYKDGTVWRTNKFMDVSQAPIDSSSDMRIWERNLLYCVPVPGQNSWTESSAEAVMHESMNWASQQREKRRRFEDEAVDKMDSIVSSYGSQGPPSAKKMREDGHPSQTTQFQESTTVATCSSRSMEPDIDRDSLACIVKIYDPPESELKLNEVFEFVGVLTLDSDFQVDKDENDDFSNGFSEDALVHFPPNKVPRLHCFIHRKLSVHDLIQSSPMMEPKPHLVKGIRETLLRHLTIVLGNDDLAAHFMLLHLLSRVMISFNITVAFLHDDLFCIFLVIILTSISLLELTLSLSLSPLYPWVMQYNKFSSQVNSRVDTVAVGKLSLNLTCFNKESVSVFGTQLSLAIENLLPITQCIPLTIDYLNTASLAPRKDYETNRLITGVLQLAEGTHLMIDETQLVSGTLNPVGVENARLLKNLMEFQKVEYDFKYYKMDMPVDIQLLILSEGKSNILPADLVIPFQPSSVGSSETVSAEALEAWRWYLTTLRSLPHSIDSEMQKVIENDLVEARQADRSLGGQDFSRLLTMGRLICMSLGETCLSLEHWQMVKELERLRRERLK